MYRLQADRLRQVAAARGDHTSYAIAKRTGLSQTTIGRLRKGIAKPSSMSLLVLARTYGIPVEELVEGITANNGDGAGVAPPTPLAEKHDSTV